MYLQTNLGKEALLFCFSWCPYKTNKKNFFFFFINCFENWNLCCCNKYFFLFVILPIYINARTNLPCVCVCVMTGIWDPVLFHSHVWEEECLVKVSNFIMVDTNFWLLKLAVITLLPFMKQLKFSFILPFCRRFSHHTFFKKQHLKITENKMSLLNFIK